MREEGLYISFPKKVVCNNSGGGQNKNEIRTSNKNLAGNQGNNYREGNKRI